MKIGVSYNFFNGDEHLSASLRTIRPCVDHISIIWQDISNAGEPITATAKAALQEVSVSGLADVVTYYYPDLSRERSDNERRKRELGLHTARRAGASHFLSMDADEFYRPNEFLRARQSITYNDWQSTSVDSYLHVKRPIWRAKDTTCCCFITRITDITEIGTSDFPCLNVDPTRRMTAAENTHHHFNANEIAMYHMNFVRRDLGQKLRNSSTRDLDFLASVDEAIRDWEPGQSFNFPRKGEMLVEVVTNEFATYDPL